jgi:hypothetical protein
MRVHRNHCGATPVASLQCSYIEVAAMHQMQPCTTLKDVVHHRFYGQG